MQVIDFPARTPSHLPSRGLLPLQRSSRGRISRIRGFERGIGCRRGRPLVCDKVGVVLGRRLRVRRSLFRICEALLGLVNLIVKEDDCCWIASE